ncbi:TetR/AcrR family transcriptional regulator [Oceanobacillus saliphilus]|uniref:TetR/AcrR family transcriptional regulator n=1 Tax=Oceanobacillus saliphilus TaxID=2925834 RepID=UPI00201D9092|nr:TetR/AcrR family transcriptional regulator [Oceanobacillus saliphilus]
MLNKEFYLDKRIVRTKKLLMESLISLLQQNNFNDLSITDITTKAKVSRVTFYNHFQDKEKLLDELINNVITDLIYSYQSPYKTYKRFTINDVTPVTVKLFDHVYQNSSFYSTIVNSDILPAFQKRLTMEMNKLALQDYIIPNPKVNNGIYANYQAYAITGMIIEWVRGGFKYSPSYMAEQLMEIVKLPGNQSLVRKN